MRVEHDGIERNEGRCLDRSIALISNSNALQSEEHLVL